VDEAEVKTVLRELLPSYKVPHAVLFFDEEEFVLTSSSKVDIRALRPVAVRRLLESDIDQTWRALLGKNPGGSSDD
jgi:hypothetical protein